MICLIFKTSSVTPDFFYVFNLILSFSICSQSFKKICIWELLGANVLKHFRSTSGHFLVSSQNFHGQPRHSSHLGTKSSHFASTNVLLPSFTAWATSFSFRESAPREAYDNNYCDKNTSLHVPLRTRNVPVKSKLQHPPPRTYPEHLTRFLLREGGNLITTHRGWGI